MSQKSARIKFARYKLAGVFDSNKNYIQGNPTFFALPPNLINHKHIEDCLFHSVLIDHMLKDSTK